MLSSMTSRSAPVKVSACSFETPDASRRCANACVSKWWAWREEDVEKLLNLDERTGAELELGEAEDEDGAALNTRADSTALER